jgi:hypothetical protein
MKRGEGAPARKTYYEIPSFTEDECFAIEPMPDFDLISTATICTLRDRPKQLRWAKRRKHAGQKTALSRKKREWHDDASGAVQS